MGGSGTIRKLPQSTGSTGAVISATDSGDHRNYTLAVAPTTLNYYVLINNLSYSTDDLTYAFSVSGSTLTFSQALASDIAGSVIKLICV